MSGRACSVCSRSDRGELDEALVRGDSMRNVVERFGTSLGSLSRHRPHIGRALVRASERKAERFEETLLEKVERLEADARRLGKRAEDEGDIRCALAAVREMGEVVKLLHELTPAPKPTADDVRRVLEWMAEEIDVPAEEIVAESEKFARIQAEILAGRTPPHCEPAARPAPSPPTPVAPPPVVAAPVQAAAPSPAPAPPTRAWAGTASPGRRKRQEPRRPKARVS